MNERTDFYQAHLDRVSRSFAFCIEQLREPLRGWVGLSYLLCRVIDTIEDAAWTDPRHQDEAFCRFDRALRGDVDALRGLTFPDGVAEAERQLLAVAPDLTRDFLALKPRLRAIVAPPIISMSLGMQHFARAKPLKLASLAEVNRYCFFVAGVVGELLAGLLTSVEPHFRTSGDSLVRAHHFGQFLQKVNVLKDQVDDEASGRFLVPDRAAVERSAAENARGALDFLVSVPVTQPEFRRFCGWSLFLGLEAMMTSRRSGASGRVLKVSRERTAEVLGEVEARLIDDARLADLFARRSAELGWAASSVAESPPRRGEPPSWFTELYEGALRNDDLRALGVCE